MLLYSSTTLFWTLSSHSERRCLLEYAQDRQVRFLTFLTLPLALPEGRDNDGAFSRPQQVSIPEQPSSHDQYSHSLRPLSNLGDVILMRNLHIRLPHLMKLQSMLWEKREACG